MVNLKKPKEEKTEEIEVVQPKEITLARRKTIADVDGKQKDAQRIA